MQTTFIHRASAIAATLALALSTGAAGPLDCLPNGDEDGHPFFGNPRLPIIIAPLSAVVVDLNGDGLPDLATANYQDLLGASSLRYASVLLNRGGGVYDPEVRYLVGDASTFQIPRSIAAADLNHDGANDLVVALGGGDILSPQPGNTIAVLINNGDGTFQNAASFVTASGPRSLAIGDVNGDTHDDVVTLNWSSDNVSVLPGDGTGGFGAKVDYSLGGIVENEPRTGHNAIYLGDIDGDSDLDIAAEAGANIAVLKNNGNGTFGTPTSYLVADASPSDFVYGFGLADVNGDNDLDLLAINWFSPPRLSVFQNDGLGSFGPRVDYSDPAGYGIGSGIQGLATADVNADGSPDVILGANNINKFAVRLNDGNGAFSDAASIYTCAHRPTAFATGDLNADGQLDVVAVCSEGSANSSQLSIHLNMGAGVLCDDGGSPFDPPENNNTAAQQGVAAGDIDGDGWLDLVTVNSTTGAVWVLHNNAGVFDTPPDVYAGLNDPISVAVADINGDAVPDVIAANSGNSPNPDFISVFPGLGGGALGAAVHYPVGDGRPTRLTVADLDGDGDTDIVFTIHTGSVRMLINDGTGGFVLGPSYDTGIPNGDPPHLVAADLNNDNAPEILVTTWPDPSSVLIFMNDGTGQFLLTDSYPVFSKAFGIDVGDYNGDTIPDMAVANTGSTSVNLCVFMGIGDGTFGPRVDYSAGERQLNSRQVASGDLDEDGDVDLVVCNVSNNTVSVLLNNGDGTFGEPVLYGTGQFPVKVLLNDFDADGRLDIVTANLFASNVSVLLNRRCVDEQACPADITDSGATNQPDGTVNVFDLLALLSNWGTAGNGANIAEPTNIVDVFDLLELLANWGDC